MRFAFSLFLMLLAGLAQLAPAAPMADADFAAAQAIFLQAVAGDGGAVEEAVRRFGKLAATDTPQAPLCAAYLGAAQAMQGRDAWMPWNKMRATERGLATLDKALRRLDAAHDKEIFRGTPLFVEIRLVAASTFLALPALFNRFDAGKQILREAFASPAYAAASGEIKARLHWQAAIAARRDKDARDEAAHLKQALATVSTGTTAESARRRLLELGVGA